MMSMIESNEPDRRKAPFWPILCTIPHAAAMIGRGMTFIYGAIGDGKIRRLSPTSAPWSLWSRCADMRTACHARRSSRSHAAAALKRTFNP